MTCLPDNDLVSACRHMLRYPSQMEHPVVDLLEKPPLGLQELSLSLNLGARHHVTLF